MMSRHTAPLVCLSHSNLRERERERERERKRAKARTVARKRKREKEREKRTEAKTLEKKDVVVIHVRSHPSPLW